MYFFFHVFAGLIVGCLIADILHDNRWIIPCAIGSVLSDLIDKPVGFLLLTGAMKTGRIWFHSLLFLGIILVLGLIVWRRWKSPILLAIAAGIFTHQVLDVMWRRLVTWYYPFRGPFRGTLPPDYLYVLLKRNLNSPSEWIFCAIIVIAAVTFTYSDRIRPIIHVNSRIGKVIMTTGSLILGIISIIIIASGVVSRSLPYLGKSRPEIYVIDGIVIALAAYLLWRWKLKLDQGNTIP